MTNRANRLREPVAVVVLALLVVFALIGLGTPNAAAHQAVTQVPNSAPRAEHPKATSPYVAIYSVASTDIADAEPSQGHGCPDRRSHDKCCVVGGCAVSFMSAVSTLVYVPAQASSILMPRCGALISGRDIAPPFHPPKPLAI